MENLNTGKYRLLLATVLAILMLLTRSNQLDWTAVLPSASLAIFFLAGFYLRCYRALLFFSALAFGIDYGVIYFGAEGCLTSAYGYIFVGYAVVWRAAKWAGEHQQLHRLADAVKIFAAALLSISAAFLISNGSFYLFSGNFSDLNLIDYAVRVAHYYQSYLSAPLIYLAAVAVIHLCVYRFIVRRQTKLESSQ